MAWWAALAGQMGGGGGENKGDKKAGQQRAIMEIEGSVEQIKALGDVFDKIKKVMTKGPQGVLELLTDFMDKLMQDSPWANILSQMMSVISGGFTANVDWERLVNTVFSQEGMDNLNGIGEGMAVMFNTIANNADAINMVIGAMNTFITTLANLTTGLNNASAGAANFPGFVASGEAANLPTYASQLTLQAGLPQWLADFNSRILAQTGNLLNWW